MIKRGGKADKDFAGDIDDSKKNEGEAAASSRNNLDETSEQKQKELEMKQILDPDQPQSDLNEVV